jgi:hypothetical protein
MAADLNAVLAVAKFCGPLDGASEQTGRVNRDGRQIAGENERRLRRKEKHVSLFDPHRHLPVVDEEPAIALH